MIENSDTSDLKVPECDVCPYCAQLYHLKFELFVTRPSSGSHAHELQLHTFHSS